MFELKKLNVHKQVETEAEREKLKTRGFKDVAEKVELTAEQIDLATRCESLKLSLPDNFTIEQVRDAVEKAEQIEREAKKGKA